MRFGVLAAPDGVFQCLEGLAPTDDGRPEDR